MEEQSITDISVERTCPSHASSHGFSLSYQMIVEAMILSLPMLADVLFLALFFFAIFGIACTELFKGTLSNRCAAPDFTYAYNETGSSVLLVGLKGKPPGDTLPCRTGRVCSHSLRCSDLNPTTNVPRVCTHGAHVMTHQHDVKQRDVKHCPHRTSPPHRMCRTSSVIMTKCAEDRWPALSHGTSPPGASR